MGEKPKDQVMLGAYIDVDTQLAARRRGDEIEIGALREMRDGVPLREGAELLAIEPGLEGEWRDVKTLYSHRATSGGPAQVATKAYCVGYERIFGKAKIGLA